MLRMLGILILVQAVSLMIPSEDDLHRLLLAVQVVVSIYLICSIITHEVDSDGEHVSSADQIHADQEVGPPLAPGLMHQYAVLQFLQQFEEKRQTRRDISNSLW